MNNDIRLRPEGALLRTYLRAAGIAPESSSKPLVGVVTVATQLISEKPDAKELGDAVIASVEASGGIAVRWDTVRTPDQLASGHGESYSFAWRDQLADFIESWTRQEVLNGLVLVGDSHSTLAGMAMAAARLNIPAVIVTTGVAKWTLNSNAESVSASAGSSKKSADVLPADSYDLLSEILFGKKKSGVDQQMQLFSQCLLGQNNHASNAFDLVLEALGLTVPGMSTAPAQSVRRHELATVSGHRIVELVQAGHAVRRVLTSNAFSNAIHLNAALGGSVDVAVHLMALAHEAGINLTLEQFDRIASKTPQLCRLGGVGAKEPHTIDDLDKAGGVWAIMNALKDKVSPTTTVIGKGAAELAKTTIVKDTHVIMVNRPYFKQSGVGLLKGNLAPRGAVFLLNQVLPALSSFQGPVVVFENEIEAAKSVTAGSIKKGSAMIIRGQGSKGGPGLPKLRILSALLESLGLNKIIPVITDGQLTDRPAGLFVSFVSPEGAVTGPLAVLKTGDVIEIDTEKRHLNIRLTEMELRIRQARWQAPDTRAKRGFLDRYSRLVSEAHEGAILK